ncbi:MAG: hypothetical protein QOI76_1967 [Frankiales bacterium]|jgi:hypothetical protein|nr:hypothetical protein [Frankiales bacterium]
MARNFRTRTRQGLRSNLHVAAPAAAPAVVLPAQPTEEDDAYTWAVNAALESGQTELAYEIAASYPA